MKEEIIPCLDLASNEFEKKVIYSLKKIGNVRINPQYLYDNEKGFVDKFAFAIMNSQSSKKKICPVCKREHYYLTKQSITEQEDNEKGLCEVCGIDGMNMLFLGVPKDKVQEWMMGKSESNVFDLIRDAIQKKIDDGEVEIKWEDIN